MKPIKIIADSTCDLSPELIDKCNITICPLLVTLDDKSLLDGVEITPDEVYAWADANNKTPGTSAPSPEAIEGLYKQFAQDNDIIVFTISSEMSSTFQSFTVLARDFTQSRITVIDSRNLSTGIGLQVLACAKMIEQGLGYEEIVEKAKAIVPRVRAGFIVDSVLYLYKGGRCSALAAFGATALKLHPTLKVEDGLIKVDKKVMGNIRAASLKYAKGLEEGILNAEDDMVFVTHAGSTDECVNDLREYVVGFNKFKNIYVTRAGCVVSSHCGAGTIGILFISK